MSRLILFSLVLMMGFNAGGQILTKRDIAPLALTFVSGFCDGTAEAIKFHYYKFDKYGLDTSNYWWNPAKSHLNKYKNRDPKQGEAFWQSTKSLVWTTDAYHCFRMGRNLTFVTAITIKVGAGKDNIRQKWWEYPLEAIVYWLTYTFGFTFAYDWIWG